MQHFVVYYSFMMVKSVRFGFALLIAHNPFEDVTLGFGKLGRILDFSDILLTKQETGYLGNYIKYCEISCYSAIGQLL